MAEKNCCVSIYPDHSATEQGLAGLRTEGVDLKQVSIVSHGDRSEAYAVGIDISDGRVRYHGHQGDFWEEVWELLTGAAFFWAPGFGPLLAAGPVTGLLAGDLQELAIGGGFGVLGTALYHMGVPRQSINCYERAVKAEKFLLIIQGERRDVERACQALHGERQQVTVHTA